MYLQSTAAHRVHDGGVVDNAILYPSIQRSQNQVAVSCGPGEKQKWGFFLRTLIQNMRQPLLVNIFSYYCVVGFTIWK